MWVKKELTWIGHEGIQSVLRIGDQKTIYPSYGNQDIFIHQNDMEDERVYDSLKAIHIP